MKDIEAKARNMYAYNIAQARAALKIATRATSVSQAFAVTAHTHATRAATLADLLADAKMMEESESLRIDAIVWM
jgi:hypothetical protein